LRVHSDERRTAYCALFDTPGDVNLFIVNPGQRTCWHRHQKQTDEFIVIRGKVRFQCFKTDPRRDGMERVDIVLHGPEQSFPVQIGWWHGYENVGDEPAYLLMYLDRKYDPTDEERMGEDVVASWSVT